MTELELKHYGILGQKWGVRRYQNDDGSLTHAGKLRQAKMATAEAATDQKNAKSTYKTSVANAQNTYTIDLQKTGQSEALAKYKASVSDAKAIYDLEFSKAQSKYNDAMNTYVSSLTTSEKATQAVKSALITGSASSAVSALITNGNVAMAVGSFIGGAIGGGTSTYTNLTSAQQKLME